MKTTRIMFQVKPADRFQLTSKKTTGRALGLGPGAMMRMEAVIQRAPFIKAFIFDMGGTIISNKEISVEMKNALADLVNKGKRVAIVSNQSLTKIRKWVEGEKGIAGLINNDKRRLFNVYGERGTIAYQLDSVGMLNEVSRISFPSSIDKREIYEAVQRAGVAIENSLFNDSTLSVPVRKRLAEFGLHAVEKEEYVELSYPKLEVEGDRTSSVARKKIAELLREHLKKEDLLSPELAVIQEKSGVVIMNKGGARLGSVNDLCVREGIGGTEVVYVGDEFAGDSRLDLPVSSTGAFCINVGNEREEKRENVFNLLGKGPNGTLSFINAILDSLSSAEKKKS